MISRHQTFQRSNQDNACHRLHAIYCHPVTGRKVLPEVSFSSAATGQIEPQAVDQAVEIINRVNQLMDNGLDFTVKVLTQSNLEAVRKDVIL